MSGDFECFVYGDCSFRFVLSGCLIAKDQFTLQCLSVVLCFACVVHRKNIEPGSSRTPRVVHGGFITMRIGRNIFSKQKSKSDGGGV